MGDNGFTDIDQATSLVRSAMDTVSQLRDGAFWKVGGEDLLALGREMESLARMVYATNVHLAGEVDTQALAKERSCPSAATLLRQTLLISPAEARDRVKAGRHVLPQEIPSGGEVPAKLPELATALDAGKVGSEHTRTIVATMKKLPSAMPTPDRDHWEKFLVAKAALLDPTEFEIVAKAVLDAADPDGSLDESDPRSKMEFNIGSRNIRTGLTNINGLLDDDGVDVVRKAIDALAAPKPCSDRTPDPRPAATRRAHALVSALRGYLQAGVGPTNGGEKPQVVVYLRWDQMTGQIEKATRENGFPMTTGEARRYLCDAKIVPVVLGGDSEILDVGRDRRTYTRAMRRAIKARDRGCVWDGCDRPAG